MTPGGGVLLLARFYRPRGGSFELFFAPGVLLGGGMVRLGI